MAAATSDLQDILDRIDLADFFDRESVVYRRTHGRSGEQLNVRECPVCGNSDWKVYLNADSGLGNCFGGSHPPEQRFNKWGFLRAYFGGEKPRELVEKLKRVAADMGWRAARTVSAAVLNQPVAGQWDMPESYPLPWQGKNLPYLENRGITSTYAAYFHLRYAPAGSYFRIRSGDEWVFQRYDQRVILPVYDLDGQLKTFQGRDTTGKVEQKYLFPPGLEGSGVHLYNGFNVRSTARIAVGEGAFDVAAMKIAFDGDLALRDVVPIGTFGKHLSEGDNSQYAKFEELRRRGVEEVTFMWDSEVQAIDDAIKAGLRLMQLGFRVRIAVLPKDKDPNEVPGDVVRQTFYEAVMLTGLSALSIRMRVRTMV